MRRSHLAAQQHFRRLGCRASTTSSQSHRKNAAHSNAYFSSLDQKTVGIRDKRYSLDKLKLDIPENKKLDLFIKSVKGTKGACRELLASALGGPIDTCEAVIRQDPEAAARKINRISEQSGPINKVKNAATKFLQSPLTKGAGKFGAIVAGGAVGTLIGISTFSLISFVIPQ